MLGHPELVPAQLLCKYSGFQAVPIEFWHRPRVLRQPADADRQSYLHARVSSSSPSPAAVSMHTGGRGHLAACWHTWRCLSSSPTTDLSGRHSPPLSRRVPQIDRSRPLQARRGYASQRRARVQATPASTRTAGGCQHSAPCQPPGAAARRSSHVPVLPHPPSVRRPSSPPGR